MAQKTVPFTFGAITVNERKMKTNKVIVHMPNRDYNPKGHDYKVRASSIDNLRKNLIHRKYPKNDTWYYEIWSEAGTPLGTLSINTYEERIRNNPISKKYRQEGDRLQWIAPKNDKVWIVDPKTGALKKRIR